VSENKKRFGREQAQSPDERRRIGTVVHDDRGNASVEWRAAPTDHERPVLEVLGEDGLTLKTEEASYDPYARKRPSEPASADARICASSPNGSRRCVSSRGGSARAVTRKRNESVPGAQPIPSMSARLRACVRR